MFKAGDRVKCVAPNDQLGGIEGGKTYEVEDVIGNEFDADKFLKVVGNKYLYYAWRFEKSVRSFKGNKHATAS